MNAKNGCMHFIDRGHQDDVLTHHPVEGMESDLLTCDPDETRMVACPIKRGSVTFHHSKTPHMTTANTSDKVAQGGDQPHAGSRRRRRRRPLSVEVLRQPAHRRAIVPPASRLT